MREHNYAVYIIASERNGTIYTGVTSNLLQRTYQHRNGTIDGFSKKYSVKLLVWFEMHGDVIAAIQREKNIKHWSRAWKLALIEKENPTWRDLFDDIAE